MNAISLSSVPAVLILLSVALPAEVALLDRPCGLAIDAAGRLLVSCRESRSVVVMTRSGQRVRQFGADRLQNPGGLCVAPSGQIIVADAGKNQLAVFDAEGRFLTTVGGLAAPEDVAAAPNGMIFVADTGHSRIAVFDSTVHAVLFSIEQLAQPRLKFDRPVGVAAAQGTLAVVDAAVPRLVVMRLPRAATDLAKAVVIPLDGVSPRAVAIGSEGRTYVATDAEVRGFSAEGQSLGTFCAKVLRVTVTNLFQPGGLAVDPQGNILAVDQHTGRVVVTNAEMLDPVPQVRLDKNTPTMAVIEWTTPLPRPTVIEYGKTDDYGSLYEDAALVTRHRAVLKDLAPATCYHYRVAKPLEMIPESAPPRPGFSLAHQKRHYQRLLAGNVSGDETFASLPESGKTDWASLPVIVLVYRNVRFPARDGNRPPNRALDDGDVAVLKSELEKYRLWLWRHTACKLNLAFSYVIVDAERDHELLGSVTRVVFDDIERGITAQGKDLHAFWNVIVVGTHGWYANYLDGPVAGTEYELGSCYTAFGHAQKPGWYWFPVHEHGHLVHSMLMNSGFGTFAFPDAPWTMPGRSGEDFSFMATNYRRQPPRSWLALRSTTICQSRDDNGNGVPDDDPRVPLDERRFGWKASLGGDCLKRLMAGVRTPGYPRGTDTDFQGKVHPLNEGELYWIDRTIPKAKVALDGRIAEGEWKELYSIPNLTTSPETRGLKATLYAAWDERRYCFAIKSNRRVIAGFDLDAANDGWFHGRDNLRFSVRPPMAGRGLEASGAIWDFLGDRMNLHDGQLWYRDAYRPGDIQAAVGQQDGWHVIECAVPARPEIRIAPGPGACFGLRAYVWSDAPEAPLPQTSFFDGEEFVYDLRCVERTSGHSDTTH
jgi:streptogramin lyase